MIDAAAIRLKGLPMNPEHIRALVAEQVRTLGTAEAARRLQMAPHTLASLAGGLPVREGTLLTAAMRLGLLAPTPAAISSAKLPSDLG